MAENDGRVELADKAARGLPRQLRIAVVARGIDRASVQFVRRALWPASAWQSAGYRVDIYLTPPSRTRLKHYAALVMIEPSRTDELNCCDEAAKLGLALVIDVGLPETVHLSGGSRLTAISATTRDCLALATVITARSSAAAEDLASLVPFDVETVVIPDPSEAAIRKARLLEVFRGELRGARIRSRLSSVPQQWLSPRGPLAAPWRMFNMARSIPFSWWLTRVPSAVARRILRRFGLIAGRASEASSEVEAKPASKAADHGVVATPVADASRQLTPHVDPATSARQWIDVMERALLTAATGLKQAPRVKVLFLLDLIQDLDVLLPIVERMRTDRRFALTVAVTDWLDKVSPRVSRELFARSVIPLVITKKDAIEGSEPDLGRINAVVTACETNHPAHRVPHAVVRRANSRGIPTYTLQHGLENVGLTYFESYPDHEGPIEMASSTILTWGPVEKLPAEMNPMMRVRCLAVGTPKPPQATRVELPLRSQGMVVAVFENLHWERYTDIYRGAFIRDLCEVAAARPAITFLLKPHHAGKYLAKNNHLLADAPSNIVLADPSVQPWEAYTASAIIGSVDAVITTPSTVALDAARAGCAVAVVGYGMALPVYEPLPVLTGTGNWLSFIDDVTARSIDLQSRLEEFRMRHVVEGDAVGRILDKILADAGRVSEVKRSEQKA